MTGLQPSETLGSLSVGWLPFGINTPVVLLHPKRHRISDCLPIQSGSNIMIGGRKESDRLEHSLISESGERKVNGTFCGMLRKKTELLLRKIFKPSLVFSICSTLLSSLHPFLSLHLLTIYSERLDLALPRTGQCPPWGTQFQGFQGIARTFVGVERES